MPGPVRVPTGETEASLSGSLLKMQIVGGMIHSHSPRERPLNCMAVCLQSHRCFGAPASHAVCRLVRRSLQAAGACRASQHSEANATETSPLGPPLRSWNIVHLLQPFPSPGRSWELAVFPGSLHTEPGVGTVVRLCQSKASPLFSAAPDLVPSPSA